APSPSPIIGRARGAGDAAASCAPPRRGARAGRGAPARRRNQMIKVLVSDKLAPQGLEVLESASRLRVDYAPGISPEALLERIADADGLVIRSGTKVTREVIEHAPKLRVIGRAGVGVDNVDVNAATERGIVVVNTPSGNNVTTAEHAIALLVSLARHIPQATASMRAGRWEKGAFTGMELANRTLGVLGLGNIGRVVAQIAQGIGMRVIAYDPHLPEEIAAKLDVELVDFDELLARAEDRKSTRLNSSHVKISYAVF